MGALESRMIKQRLVLNTNCFEISRLACGGVARTNDQTTLLTLYLVSGALKALLRPGDLSSVDKGPAESLSSKFHRCALAYRTKIVEGYNPKF